MAKHIENGGLELATSACISVAVLTDSDHHQGRICDHVPHLKQKSGLYIKLICNTVTLSVICTSCNKDRDMQFVPICSRVVALSTEYFQKPLLCPKVIGCFIKTVRILMIYSTAIVPIVLFNVMHSRLQQLFDLLSNGGSERERGTLLFANTEDCRIQTS